MIRRFRRQLDGRLPTPCWPVRGGAPRAEALPRARRHPCARFARIPNLNRCTGHPHPPLSLFPFCALPRAQQLTYGGYVFYHPPRTLAGPPVCGCTGRASSVSTTHSASARLRPARPARAGKARAGVTAILCRVMRPPPPRPRRPPQPFYTVPPPRAVDTRITDTRWVVISGANAPRIGRRWAHNVLAGEGRKNRAQGGKRGYLDTRGGGG